MRKTTEMQARFIDLVKDMRQEGIPSIVVKLLVLAVYPEGEDVNCDIEDDSCIDPCCGCKR